MNAATTSTPTKKESRLINIQLTEDELEQIANACLHVFADAFSFHQDIKSDRYHELYQKLNNISINAARAALSSSVPA